MIHVYVLFFLIFLFAFLFPVSLKIVCFEHFDVFGFFFYRFNQEIIQRVSFATRTTLIFFFCFLIALQYRSPSTIDKKCPLTLVLLLFCFPEDEYAEDHCHPSRLLALRQEIQPI